jgi:UDP-N-acetylglucosamine diphosphorylase/glucosamine-1-phosphate N-acetyltransferase
MPDRVAIVLAAGKGTRMNSELPKVLVPACGRPMIHYVLDALERAGFGRTLVVVGYRADDVRQELAGRKNVEFAEQREQLGTGHAVKMCRQALAAFDGPVAVLTGDSPLVQDSSLQKLIADFERRKLACLLGTLHHPQPKGLGRILRDERSGEFQGIVEEKDASAAQRAITEVNMSTYVFDCRDLFWSLEHVNDDNAQREQYLTDCPGVLKRAGKAVDALPVLQACESLSINTMDDLARVEEEMRRLGYPRVSA